LRPRKAAIAQTWSYVRVPDHAGLATLLLAALIFWPWLTLLSLALLRASMRQARLRTIHVMRCVLYCYDVGIWLAAYVALFALPRMLWRMVHDGFYDGRYDVPGFTW